MGNEYKNGKDRVFGIGEVEEDFNLQLSGIRSCKEYKDL